jgi:dienelactone hydrolase
MRIATVLVILCIVLLSCCPCRKTQTPAAGGAWNPTSTDVEIDAGAGPLAGTLLVPAGEGPFPGIVIVAGSGPTDRDGNNLFLKGQPNYLKDMAERLAKEGYASLRYDKRGVGKTPAGDKPADRDVFVSDCRAAFEFLTAKPGIDAKRVALLGHSEGGLVATLASKEVNAAALILVSTAGRPILEIFEDQVRALIDSQLEGENRDAATKMLEDFLARLAAGGEIDLGPAPEFFSDDLKLVFGEVVKPAKAAIMRTLYTVDPAEEVVSFKGPILIVHGEGDAQVPLDDSKLLEAALAKSGHASTTLEIVPGMDHVLKQLSGDKPEPYDGPGRKLSEKFLQTLSLWLSKNLSSAEQGRL